MPKKIKIFKDRNIDTVVEQLNEFMKGFNENDIYDVSLDYEPRGMSQETVGYVVYQVLKNEKT